MKALLDGRNSEYDSILSHAIHICQSYLKDHHKLMIERNHSTL